MKVVIFCHSLVSDWNHGNAHFLRGVTAELQARGHDVHVLEPQGGWSRTQLTSEDRHAEKDFARAFPDLASETYELRTLDLDRVLGGADLVLVHEWNDPELVRRVGEHRRRTRSYRLLFHDTHHRAATAPQEMERFELADYDGVLAFGVVIRDLYLARGWAQRGWVWHEAADTRIFTPLSGVSREEDLVWVGNWGDGERASELDEFLLEPARRLELTGTIHGVRYPPPARTAIDRAGLRYGGWLANHRVPEAFARRRFTVHVPRRPYVQALPGIPTIRVFEALACAIPLICAPWEDAERLFRPGEDYLLVANGPAMERAMAQLRSDDELCRALARSGLETILSRHTCAHRAAELLEIDAQLTGAAVCS